MLRLTGMPQPAARIANSLNLQNIVQGLFHGAEVVSENTGTAL